MVFYTLSPMQWAYILVRLTDGIARIFSQLFLFFLPFPFTAFRIHEEKGGKGEGARMRARGAMTLVVASLVQPPPQPPPMTLVVASHVCALRNTTLLEA